MRKYLNIIKNAPKSPVHVVIAVIIAAFGSVIIADVVEQVPFENTRLKVLILLAFSVVFIVLLIIEYVRLLKLENNKMSKKDINLYLRFNGAICSLAIIVLGVILFVG